MDKLRGTRRATGMDGVIGAPRCQILASPYWGKNGAVGGQDIVAKGSEILSVFSLNPLLQQLSSHGSYTLLSI